MTWIKKFLRDKILGVALTLVIVIALLQTISGMFFDFILMLLLAGVIFVSKNLGEKDVGN